MLKDLIESLWQTLWMPRPQIPRSLAQAPSQTDCSDFVQRLARDPLNAILHLQYATEAAAAHKPYLAYAELKTAQYLGAVGKETERLLSEFTRALPDRLRLNHNQYFRLISLTSELISRAGGCTEFSVLDVGGGDGRLAAFIQHASYCLAEPDWNGISGTDLPFADHSFDFVVSCHVLEHIPVDKRSLFLDQLLSKARRGLILLNPFQIEGTHVEERLKLVIEITDARWAKEHLDCTLPRVDEVRSYALAKKLQMSIKPNGTLTTSLVLVFVDYFANKTGSHEEWIKINTFLNEKYTPILNSSQYPNAYLIYLGWPESGSVAEHDQLRAS